MAMQTFSQSLPMMLYSALDAVMPRFRRIFKDFGLTEQQWRVLRVLWEADPVAFQTMSDITLIPAPSLVGVIDRLQKSGLVRRQRSENDRRMVFIHATAAGQQLEKKVRPHVVRLYAELQASVNPEVWDQLLAGLGNLISTCDNANEQEKAVNQ